MLPRVKMSPSITGHQPGSFVFIYVHIAVRLLFNSSFYNIGVYAYTISVPVPSDVLQAVRDG